jgi:hypothetical protein
MIDAGKRLRTLVVSLLENVTDAGATLVFGMKKGDPALLQESEEGPH